MKTIRQKSLFAWGLLGVLIVLLLGCGGTQEKKPAQPGTSSSAASEADPGASAASSGALSPAAKVEYMTHEVTYPGESLSIIAAWYIGDKMKYDILIDANPGINPKSVVIGQKILIPKHEMKTQDPMPRSHVEKFYPHPATHKPSKVRVQDKKTPGLINPD